MKILNFFEFLSYPSISWVHEHTTIKQCSVNIAHHRTDVPEPGSSRPLPFLLVLNILLGSLIPVHGVTLVDRVDLPRLRDPNVWMGEDKGPQSPVIGVAVDLAGKRQNEDGRGTVNTVAGGYDVPPVSKDIGLQGASTFSLFSPDTENGSDTDVTVDVAGAVERVDGYQELSIFVAENCFLFFLAGNDSNLKKIRKL